MTSAASMIPEDVVAAVLAHLPKDEFEADSTTIQKAFQSVKKKHPDMLAALTFNQAALLGKSEELASALDTLSRAHYIHRFNPDFRCYKIDREKLKDYYQRVAKPSFEQAGISEQDLTSAAADFARRIDELQASAVEDLLT